MLGKLLYGYQLSTKHEKLRFAEKMNDAGASPPKLHMFIMNRATIYGGELARAFDAMSKQMIDTVKTMHQSPYGINMFSERDPNALFRDMNVPDAHSVGVIMSHRGLPLHKVRSGRKYGIGAAGANVQCTKDQKKRYQDALDNIVAGLDLGD